MQTILITGVNGFLGSSLAKAFSDDYIIIGLEYGLDSLHRIKDCNYNIYDVCDGIPKKLFTDQKIDIIIHAATFYGRQNESVKALATANSLLPFELLDQAINNGCTLFINTDTVLDRFTNVYALTKRHFQEWLYMRRKEIKVINMQLEHFYGPGAGTCNFIASMIKRLKKNESQIDLTLGEQRRDFVYVDDVVNAYQTVLKNQNHITNAYSTYQVCTNQLISIKKLMLMLKGLTKSSSKLNFGAVPYRENELMHSETDNSALINLGWQTKFTIKKGLQQTLCNSY